MMELKMPFTVYIRNLNFQTTEENLKQAFAIHGDIESVKIPRDKFKKRPRGFGFVTYKSQDSLEAAIAKMDNTELDGRTIQVQKAKPQANKGYPDNMTHNIKH